MRTKTTTHGGAGFQRFVAAHGADVTGVISGYDRLRLRGSLRHLYRPSFMFQYLCSAGVRLKDFAGFVSGLTNRVSAASAALAERYGRPLRHLKSCVERKEDLARRLAEHDRIHEGLIGVYSILEPCLTYKIRHDADAHRLYLHLGQGRCLHHYSYFQHAEFGLMHLRLQTWFPFQLMVCLDGRLWLARQMDRAHLDYVQRDNSFVWLGNPARAQALADQQLRTDWLAKLAPFVAQCHPLAREICAPLALNYYWSLDQTEFATDLLFRSPGALARLYPALVDHGIRHLGTPEVMRFLGRTVPAHGHVHRLYKGEVETDLKHSPEGVRLKHFAQGNGVKLYDKHGQVLRVETTMTNPEAFRVHRTPESRPKGRKRWMLLRKSVADAPRRAQVCAAVNGRYLDALATASVATPAGELAAPLCRRATKKHRHYRALNPWSPADATVLETIARAAAAMKEQLEQVEEEIKADAPPAPVGVGALTAGTLEREVLDWKRFPSGKKLGSFAGLCPSEDSSGTRRRQGSIDKHGSPRLRFWCQEAVWRLYKFQPGYKGVVWARGQLIKANQSRAKQVAVALARRFLVDWWRVRTGRIDASELGLTFKEASAV